MWPFTAASTCWHALNGDLWTSAAAERLKAAHMALIPTLTLWDVEWQEVRWVKRRNREVDGQRHPTTKGVF